MSMKKDTALSVEYRRKPNAASFAKKNGIRIVSGYRFGEALLCNAEDWGRIAAAVVGGVCAGLRRSGVRRGTLWRFCSVTPR
jgi:hypothetical protein